MGSIEKLFQLVPHFSGPGLKTQGFATRRVPSEGTPRLNTSFKITLSSFSAKFNLHRPSFSTHFEKLQGEHFLGHL